MTIKLEELPKMIRAAYRKGKVEPNAEEVSDLLEGTFISQLAKDNNTWGAMHGIVSGGAISPENNQTFVQLSRGWSGSKVYFTSTDGRNSIVGEIDKKSLERMEYVGGNKEDRGERLIIPCVDPAGYSIGIHRKH